MATGNVKKESGKTARVRYELDPHNRLIVTGRGPKAGVARFRRVLDGRLELRDNTLYYHVKQPQGTDTAQQFKFTGIWSLDRRHNLTLALDRWQASAGRRKLTVSGILTGTGADRLKFTAASSKGASQGTNLSLDGRWQIDRRNRLLFAVRRADGARNNIVLKAGWELDAGNSIIYQYEQTDLKTRRKVQHTLSLKGFWQMGASKKLSYILRVSDDRSLDFTAGIGTPTRRGLLFQLGGSVGPAKKLVLSGKWHVDDKLGLVLEFARGSRGTGRIVFGATFKLDNRGDLAFQVSHSPGKPTFEVSLSRKILANQGEIFVRGVMDRDRGELFAGLALRW